MSPKITSALIRYIQRNVKNWRIFKISWFGGEPLLSYSIIIDLLRQLCEIADRSGIYFRSDITTNGYLLDKNTAIDLISYRCRTFHITVDGPSEVHDKRRVLVSGGKTYKIIFNNILNLLTIPKQFKIIVRVNYDNDSLSFLPDWVKSLKTQVGDDSRLELSYNAIWNSCNSHHPKSQLCNYSQMIDSFVNLCLYSYKAGFNPIQFIKKLTPNGNVCYAAKKKSFVILPDGRVLKCTAALDEPVNQIGRLTEDGRIIFDQEKLNIWDNLIRKSESCDACWYYPACRGANCPRNNIVNGFTHMECPIEKSAIPEIIRTCF